MTEPGAAARDELTRRVKERAEGLGFPLVGITRPGASDHIGHYRRWLSEAMHGEMTYLSRPDAVERRRDVGSSADSVRSVVVVGHPYGQADPPGVPEDASLGVIARYARGRDYHKVVGGKLRSLGRWIVAQVPPSGEDGLPRGPAPEEGGRTTGAEEGRFRVYVDTGPLLEREIARRAGVGWFGKNTMLIHPRRGSYFFLGVLLVDVELDPDPPFERDHCGSCRACLDACPTGALLGRDEHGAPIMDARRCISYLTIEHRGSIPPELRPAIGNRIYGCDICQEVCPFNVAFSEKTAEPAYAARGPGERPEGVEALPGETIDPGDVPGERRSDGEPTSNVSAGTFRAPAPTHPGTKEPSLVALMRMTRDQWDAFSRGSPIRRAGYAGFKRNVAVALGNWLAGVDEPPEDAVAVLREASEDEEALVREHAAWALERR